MDALLLAALQQFQDGYTRRDVQTLDAFMELFIAGDELEVIGTSASSTTNDEWSRGRDAVQALVKADWEEWGNLALDLDHATMHVLSDVAWIATLGTYPKRSPQRKRTVPSENLSSTSLMIKHYPRR
jgi:hypothetical protein